MPRRRNLDLCRCAVCTFRQIGLAPVSLRRAVDKLLTSCCPPRPECDDVAGRGDSASKHCGQRRVTPTQSLDLPFRIDGPHLADLRVSQLGPMMPFTAPVASVVASDHGPYGQGICNVSQIGFLSVRACAVHDRRWRQRHPVRNLALVHRYMSVVVPVVNRRNSAAAGRRSAGMTC